MFTGLVESLGRIQNLEPMNPGIRLLVESAVIAEDAQLGDSIAVNGCCLTAIRIDHQQIAFEAGPETLQKTNLSRLKIGSVVNLERSLKVGDRLGGHYVSGHVDAVGSLLERKDENDWSEFWFAVPPELTRQMAGKGSIAVDGVSLTLVDVLADRFSVALIPHTLEVTTLGKLQPGDPVNLETDLLAKYVEKQLEFVGR